MVCAQQLLKLKRNKLVTLDFRNSCTDAGKITSDDVTWYVLYTGVAYPRSRSGSCGISLSILPRSSLPHLACDLANPHVHTFDPSNRRPYVTASLAATRPICHSSHFYALAPSTMASLASLLGLCRGISCIPFRAFPSVALCRLSAHHFTPNLTPRKRTSSRSIFQQCRIHTPRRHPNITNDRSSYKAVVHRKLGEINICFHGPHELDVDTPQTVSLWRSSRSTHHVGMSFWVFDRNTV
jgi:hypothetical protein